MDKRYWVARCDDGEILALSTYQSTREEFEQKCSAHPYKKSESFSIAEMPEEEFLRALDDMPPWMRPLLNLRKEATRKIFKSLKDVKYDQIACATIGDWRLRLSVDHVDGPFMFHLSARHVTKGCEVTEHELATVGELLISLGAMPLPPLLSMTSEAFHFRWPAMDVSSEDLN